MKVWCVGWLEKLPDGERPMRLRWCATYRGHKHQDTAVNVKTACGYFVVLPCGGERRVPTCADCKKRVARRRR